MQDGAPEPWQLLANPEELQALQALGVQLLFPLAGRTRLAGFAGLQRANGRPFTRAELRLLQELGPRLGRGLETALLLESLSVEAVERDRRQRELLLAREVQEHLLPGALPRLPGLELAALYRSSAEVGGDYYDAFLTSSGALCFLVADVSGKGVPAALVMAALRASVHALVLQPEPALDVMAARLNDLLFASSAASRYATLFLAMLSPDGEEISYCNAGHNAPVLLRAHGEPVRLDGGGSVLGLLAGLRFQTLRMPFHPGDTLVCYTDGITEATNPAGQEWGEDGLCTVLRAARDANADATLAHVQAAMHHFSAATPPVDDATLLIVRRTA